jgi:hypothetical protein
MGELPSWIDVSEDQGRPKVVMVGVSDHATELKTVDLKDGELEFLSPKGEEGFRDDTLFNGKDFSGWRFSGARHANWKVEDDTLVHDGHGAEIITTSKFEDFKLQFNCGPKANREVTRGAVLRCNRNGLRRRTAQPPHGRCIWIPRSHARIAPQGWSVAKL